MISLLWWSVYILVLAAAVAKIAAQNVQLSAFKDSTSATAAAQAIKSTASCGGTLTATQGVIQTPNFPNKFLVPMQCTWIIDASAINKQNVSIVVYFTQQYVLSGLKFTEYAYYSDDIKVKSDHAPFQLNEQTVTQVSWVRFYSQFLEIKFTMDNLYGTHLRALDRLLDVYGFNITYEMDGVPKPYQCNAILCRYLGHCYATENFSSYYCSCFPGFSGSDCGVGPLCRDGDKDFCENGGICKQIGDAGVTCICPKGFKGKKCQIPEDEDMNGCFGDDQQCDSLCHFSGPEQNFCKCTQSTSISNRERARYEATVHLGNASQQSSDSRNERRRTMEYLPIVLEKQVNRVLRNVNVTRINDLEVVSTDTANTGIKIQFFGAKQDASRVQEAIQKMVDRGRLANVTIVPSSLIFREEAVLQIESVSINYKTAVRHNDEFILSCVARGSKKIIFRWYKNGVYVNQTKATRKIWARVYENPQIKDHYTALLGIPKASRLDEGVYTCQVSDYGMQQCRSTVVHVTAKPELRLDPPSATVYRGDSVRIRCLSNNIDQSNGYSWTKNNALFQSDAETELWEDLYPDGSILKINNIQKSANYTCVSANSVGQVSKSVYVYVVDRGTIELCANETLFGVNWPPSSPGSPILAECPKHYEGQSQRICELHDFGKPAWLTPNFSGCLADTLVDVYNEFRGLTFGYEKTNGSAVLKSCLEYAMSRHTNFLPGEAGFLLKLLQEVNEYLTERGSEIEQEVAADITLQILDVVLKSEHSLNNQQQVEDLQELVKTATLKRDLITSPVPVPAPSTSLHYHQTGSFSTHKEHIKSLPFSSQVYGDHLFSDQLYMEMALTPQLQEIVSNGSIVLSVISYKNLTNFLPRMYFERNTHTPDIDYMTASRVIASWLIYANRTLHEAVVPTSQLLHLPMTAAHVEIKFQHENPPDSDWKPVCGYDLQATYKATWNTDLCITDSLMDNMTRCVCPLSGTYVVLMSKRNYNSTTVQNQQHPMFVVVSCGCCFLQSCIAFGILLPILYRRKCSVTFLKMQFCTATSTAMAIFTLGFLKFLPQDWHGIISSSLGGVLLLGSSTLIAITMVIDSELGPRKSPTAHLSGGMRGAIGLSWFMPILYAVTTLLIYTVMGDWPSNWWTVDTIGFALFVIIETLFVILFSLLFYTLVHKLSYLAKKHDKHGILITKRIGLVYRITCLLVLKISTDILYLMYSNSNEILFSYIFGALSICLGFTLLVCFVIKAETKLKSDALSKSNSKPIIEDYCSGSINSPLNFYTNHEIEKDNDCAVPSSQSSTKKLPLAITTRRYPVDRLQTTSNITDPYITTGGLCETTFLELNDPSANLDVNFIEFKQHPNQQQPQPQQQQQQQQSALQPSTLSKQPSPYPTLLNANGYELEIVPTDLSLYGSSCKPSQGKCYLSETNDFVGVGSLDILQGVRQDSVIGIRSNYSMNDQMINPDSNLSALVPSTSNVTASDGLHSHANQNQLLFDKNHEKSPQKILESVNVHAVDTQATASTLLTAVAPPPTITVTPTDETDKTIDGMLDRISHDLDYLLNRMAEIPPAPPPPTSVAPSTLHSNNLSVREVILEEEAEDL